MSPNRVSVDRGAEPIRIGLVADEPIRLAGLASVFDPADQDAEAQFLPVVGTLPELLALVRLEFLIIDLHSPSGGLKTLDAIRRVRPDMRSIVIGPEGNDDLILRAIAAGARAYVEQNAGPETVRMAIDVVTNGSIWAPRRLLSKLIDRLLDTAAASHPIVEHQLTDREHQVLELILKAHSNREIAAQLGIEERTVRAHLARLMRKAGVDNRIKLSMSARQLFGLPRNSASRIATYERARRSLTNK